MFSLRLRRDAVARRALTVVEIIVSTALILLAVVFLLTLMPVLAKSCGDTQMSSQALYAAQEKLDDILRQNLRVSTLPTSDTPPHMPNATRTVVGTSDPLGNPRVSIVTVTVTWKEGTRVRSITLRSAVSP